MIRVFIGYDPREAIAYHVCANSIIRHASQPVSITPLALNTLGGIYTERHTDGSNQFIYSRFLVPWLCGFSGRAIFLDGDMVVTGDIAELWALADDWYAARVVQHDYRTKAASKYLGAKNEDYPRKNWSSVILWNCAHYDNRHLTPENVATMTGAELHRFTWIKKQDRIGELPPEWNWLETEYEPHAGAKLVHYTLGTPCWPEYATTPMAHLWHEELLCTVQAEAQTIGGIAARAERAMD